MKIVNKYSYPKSSRAKLDGLRHYTIDGSQKKLPSVTTVLGQTQPKEKQESLERWRNRVGLREAQKITRDAAIRGTAMHKYLEDLLRGQRSLDLTPLGVEAENMAKRLMDLAVEDRLRASNKISQKPIVIVGKAYKPLVEYETGSSSMLVGHYIQEQGMPLY